MIVKGLELIDFLSSPVRGKSLVEKELGEAIIKHSMIII